MAAGAAGQSRAAARHPSKREGCGTDRSVSSSRPRVTTRAQRSAHLRHPVWRIFTLTRNCDCTFDTSNVREGRYVLIRRTVECRPVKDDWLKRRRSFDVDATSIRRRIDVFSTNRFSYACNARREIIAVDILLRASKGV